MTFAALPRNGARDPESSIHRRLFDEIPDAVVGVDERHVIVLCNRAAETTFGWSMEELIGKPIGLLVPAARAARVSAALAGNAASGTKSGRRFVSVKGLRRDGSEFDLGTSTLQTCDDQGNPLLVAVLRDVSEKMRYLREIERLANTDELTGLAVRRHFFQELDQLIIRQGSGQGGFWLALIDIDGFRLFNDHYGHAFGDALLKETAVRIRRLVPRETLIGRLGGDEFAVAVADDGSGVDLDLLGRKLVAALGEPVLVADRSLPTSVCAGFARFPSVAGAVDGLIERATFSLQQAKKVSRGSVNVFTSAVENQFNLRSNLERCVGTAAFETELRLEYQPVVSLRTGALTYLEALARWDSKELGAVGPQHFIPAAERCGRIHEITEILFAKALASAAAWPDSIGLSFNLSAHDILAASRITRLSAMLHESAVDPSRVQFEITETAIMTDFEQATQSLAMLADAGSRVALDDFGCGYASYGYVDRLPLHTIKLDKSFVGRLHSSQQSYKVMKGVGEFVANLGLNCVAEGVETAADYARVAEANIPFVQGYFLSRPVPENKIPGLIEMAWPSPHRPTA